MQQLQNAFGEDPSTWSDEARLGYAGVMVRHVELGVPAPDDALERAIAWLRDESLEWDEDTLRTVAP